MSAVAAWFLRGVDAFGWDDVDDAVGCACGGPLALVQEVMMDAAEHGAVVDVGCSALVPGL